MEEKEFNERLIKIECYIDALRAVEEMTDEIDILGPIHELIVGEIDIVWVDLKTQLAKLEKA